MKDSFIQDQIQIAIGLIKNEDYTALSFLFINASFRFENPDYCNKLIDSDKAIEWTENYCKDHFSPLDTTQEITDKFERIRSKIQGKLSIIQL